MPHHAVFDPRKLNNAPTVFHSAASTKCTVMYYGLASSPVISKDLTGMLLRIRLYSISLVRNIEKMFSQPITFAEDRLAPSFLWYRDGHLDESPAVYELRGRPFGETPSPCNAHFVLRQIGLDNATVYEDAAIKTLYENFYADIYLVSVRSVVEAVEGKDEPVRNLHEGTVIGMVHLHGKRFSLLEAVGKEANVAKPID